MNQTIDASKIEELKKLSENKRWSDSFLAGMKDYDCLEIGGGDGVSTRYFSKYCKRVFVIDPWIPALDEKENIHFLNYQELTKDLDNVFTLRDLSDSEEARKFLMEQKDINLGFSYIDGEPSAEAVVNDWVLGDRWLIKGGYVFINNCENKKVDFGVGWVNQHFNYYYTELDPSSKSLSVWDDSETIMKVFRKL